MSIEGLTDFVMSVQHLINYGWKFEVIDNSLTATRGDQRVNDFSADRLIEEMLEEERRLNDEKLLNWYKEHKGLCPTCKIKPPINTYSCPQCGWKL